MKVALYARVNKDEQDAEVQLAALRVHVATRGWQIVEEFVDYGHSGARERRPALDGLMRAVQDGKIEAVLVYRFDRFARSVKHLVTALEQFRSLHVDFISLHDQLDTVGPVGQVISTVIGAMAHLERDITSARIRAGLDQARARGTRLGRPVVPVTGHQVAALRLTGLGLGSIARHFRCSRATVRRRLRELGTPDRPASSATATPPRIAP